jgi:exopolysaccharide production protein ExoZ
MRLSSIQFLRAVAVLLVVYTHSMNIQMQFGHSWQQTFYHLDNFGCIGVDLFFVISGFIIMFIANKYKGANEAMYFIGKRFLRINPIYYIATFLIFGFLLLKLYINDIPFKNHSDNTISSLFDSLTIIPSSWDLKYFSPLLVVGWTLSFEWLFYILFAALIFMNVERKVLTMLCMILLFVGIGRIIQPTDLRFQFVLNPILLEFVLGLTICQLYLSKINVPTWVATIILSTGIICYVLLIRFGYEGVWYYQNTINGKLSLMRFLLWGLPSGCIVAGSLFLERNGHLSKLFNNRLALLLGNASYSIYLIHYIILNAFQLIYSKTIFFGQADLMIWLQLIITVFISVVFYKLVEKPLLSYFNKKERPLDTTIKNNTNLLDKSNELAPT